MWNATLFALSVIISVLSALAASWCAVSAIRRWSSLDKRIRSIESRQRSITDSLSGWSSELEALSQRVKMQRVRNATTHATKERDGLPDPYKEPDAWRAAVNRKLAFGKMPEIN